MEAHCIFLAAWEAEVLAGARQLSFPLWTGERTFLHPPCFFFFLDLKNLEMSVPAD